MPSRLLAGAAADESLAAALGRVSASLPYLQAFPRIPGTPALPGRVPADGEWACCHELLGDKMVLRARLVASSESLGAPSLAVGASLFVLGYSYRVLTLAVCSLLLGGATPRSRAGDMAIAFNRGRPAFVAYRHSPVLVLPSGAVPGRQELSFIMAGAVEEHLRSLVVAVRAAVRVGVRLFWGNIAASAALAFRTAEGLLGEEVKQLGLDFFAIAPKEMQRQGEFLALEHEGRRGWFWERRNCCLNDRCPGHIRCSDCSQTPRAQRRACYREILLAD